MTNPILEEIYKYRAEHAARFGYDVHRMFADARERERLAATPLVNRRKPAAKQMKTVRAGS